MPCALFFDRWSCCTRNLGMFWLLAWLLLPGLAMAQDHITERAWLEDTSGQLGWPGVQQYPTTPYTGLLSKGFGASTIWLRLRLDPAAHPASLQDPARLVLRIRPVYLDDIQVFDPLVPVGLIGRTGDLHHPRNDALQGLDFMLPMARGTQARDIWLRLSSTSTRQIDVQALNMEDLQRHALFQSLVFAVYIGLVLVLAVWGGVHWLFRREPLIGAFGLKQANALAFALCSLGYLRALWPQHWPARFLHEATTVFSITAVSAAILFHVLLLREFKPPRWMWRLLLGILALLPLKLALVTLGLTSTALRINMSEILLTPVVFLLSAMQSQAWDSSASAQPVLSRKTLVGFYALLVGMLGMAALPSLGWLHFTEVSLYIVQVHGLVTALLVLLILQYRAHMQQQQQRDTALALERSQLQAQQERHIREEQEKLLAMLAHELKTPLATMHMRLSLHAPGSREIRQAIRDMNGVIDRCMQTAQLGDRQLQVHLDTVDLVDLVHDAVSSCAQPDRVQLHLPTRQPVQTDLQLLFIVLSNLLENACKYAAPQTPIQLSLKNVPASDSDPAGIRLEISNQPGQAGWPDPDQLFEKYYRSPHARRQAGTGLGLYLVRNLVHTLGGSITYAPDAHQIRFVLMLPSATPATL